MQATNTRHVVDHRAGAAAVLAAVIFAAGIALGSVIDLGLPAVGGATAIPIGDRSYDAVEETRARGLGLPIPVGDRSYDAVEETRARGLGLPIPVGDRSYDAIEETRANSDLD